MDRIVSQVNAPALRMQEQVIANMTANAGLQKLVEAQMAPVRKMLDQIAKNNQSLIADITRNLVAMPPVLPAAAKPRQGSRKKGTGAGKPKTPPETPTTGDNEPQ
jgi:hypothetical protein